MNKERFSKDFLKGTREKLEARRRELLSLERETEREGLIDLNAESTDEISHMRLHPADLGTTEFDRDLDLALAQTETREIQEIDETLARIANARYGTCEECGAEIPYARLEALPYTRYCASCETKLEAESRRRMRPGQDHPLP